MKGYSILFDWDGCLANTLPQWYLALKETFEELGLQAKDTELLLSMQDWAHLPKYGVTDIPEFANCLYANFYRHLDDITLNPGANEILIQLHERQAKLAIVTSSPLMKLEPVINRLGISGLFETLITKDDVTNLKPHPEPLHLAMNRMGAQVNRALMVGDSVVDVQAGISANIRTIWYHPSHNAEFHNAKLVSDLSPDHKIDHWQKIMSLI